MISLIKKKGINPQDKTTLYFPQWTRIATVDGNQLAKRMARGSTYSVGEVSGVMQDFPAQIIDELLNGNAVRIDGLGTFKLRVSGKAKTDIKEVTTQGCTISVNFEPATELMSRLNDEREFRFVTKPTAEGEQDVNDDTTGTIGSEPDGGDGSGTGGTTTGGNTGGNTGGTTTGGGSTDPDSGDGGE